MQKLSPKHFHVSLALRQFYVRGSCISFGFLGFKTDDAWNRRYDRVRSNCYRHKGIAEDKLRHGTQRRDKKTTLTHIKIFLTGIAGNRNKLAIFDRRASAAHRLSMINVYIRSH